MKRSLSLLAVLFLVWLLWSGHFTSLLLISLGVASCLLAVLVAARMGLIDEEGAPLQLTTWRTALYVPWLALEIVKANLDVARRILTPSLPIAPRIIRVPASQRSEIGRVVYANSITLTPGTVSMHVEEGSITVHALTAEAAAGVEAGEMDRRVRQLEGRG